MQSISHCWHIAWRFRHDQGNGGAVESALLDGTRLGRTESARPVDILGANIEVRALTIVTHQKRAAIRKASIDMHDRPATGPRA